MMEYQREFAKDAINDIDWIFMYSLENYGKKQALKYKEQLNQALSEISRMPIEVI